MVTWCGNSFFGNSTSIKYHPEVYSYSQIRNVLVSLQIISVPSAIDLPLEFFLVDASDGKLLAE